MATNASDRQPHIVVVGPCASGKTTLVEELKIRGFDAAVCGQEHSEIPNLWQHSNPDVLVLLDIDLETIRSRRGQDWSESIYHVQLERLRQARGAADLIIDTSASSTQRTIEETLAHLRENFERKEFVAPGGDN
ncbi:MAG: GTPase domain-containing protein [Thermomicrobiales bacterium]